MYMYMYHGTLQYAYQTGSIDIYVDTYLYIYISMYLDHIYNILNVYVPRYSSIGRVFYYTGMIV